MGVLVWKGDLVGPRTMLGFAVLPSPFIATTDSSFQNTYEYLAILLGLLLSKTLGLRDCVFAVLGGSRSSTGKRQLQTFVTFLQKLQPRKNPAVGFCTVLYRHKTSKAVL
jgi:hypothetical protein